MDILQGLTQTIYTRYQAADTNGVFVSAYDQAGKLLISQGIVQSEDTVTQKVTTLHDTYLKPLQHVELVMIDIVKNLMEQKEYAVVLGMDPHDYGLVIETLDQQVVGVLLPNTAEVADMAHAIYAIKQKHSLTGDVILYTFQTDRLAYSPVFDLK